MKISLQVLICYLVLLCTNTVLGVGQKISDAPDGVSIKLFDDGSYQVTAVSSDAYDFDDDDDVLDARRGAEMRAKAAIVKFLKEELSTESGFSEASQKVKHLTTDGGMSQKSVSKDSVKSTLETIRTSASSLLRGVIVLQDERMPRGDGGVCRVMVGVSSKTVVVAEKATCGIANSLQERTASSGESHQSTAALFSVQIAQERGLPPPPEGWLICIGVGSDRKSAVAAALVEGVSQVFGAKIQNESKLSARFAKFKSNAKILGRELSVSTVSSTEDQESNTITETAGFVREYRIAQVVEKNGQTEATIYAYVVDPDKDGVDVVLVAPPRVALSLRTVNHQLGPKRRMSGSEIGQELSSALPSGLIEANRFVVVDIDSEMVDYVLDTELLEVQYAKKLAMDKVTKKIAPQYKFAIRVKCSLRSKAGAVVKSDDIVLTLSSAEIAVLLAEDEGADLLKATLRKLARSVTKLACSF